MSFWYYLHFCILTLKSSQAKIVNIYISNRNLYILGENTSKYRSRIIVVYVHATVFSKVHQACHNIVMISNQEVTIARLISILWIAQKLCVGIKVIYVRCIKCSYNNEAKGIRLLDKKNIFFIQEKIHASKNFEIHIPLISFGSK